MANNIKAVSVGLHFHRAIIIIDNINWDRIMNLHPTLSFSNKNFSALFSRVDII